MDRKETRREPVELLDLGAASTETKGSAAPFNDLDLGQRVSPIPGLD